MALGDANGISDVVLLCWCCVRCYSAQRCVLVHQRLQLAKLAAGHRWCLTIARREADADSRRIQPRACCEEHGSKPGARPASALTH